VSELYWLWGHVNPAAQLVGVAGIITGVLWPLLRRRSYLLATQAVCFFIFALHFWLLDARTATFLNILGGLQAAAAIPLERWRPFRFVYIATLPPIFAGVALTWQGWPSAFAGLGVVLTSVSRYQIKLWRLRLFSNCGLLLWLCHNTAMFSIAGVITDLGGIIGNSVMLWRERRAARTEEVMA
jgi:hypothetical protein